MRVLLVGPADPRSPDTGESAYIRLLLEHPPAGVEFVYHLDALERGEVERTRPFGFLRFLLRTGVWLPDVHVECLKLKSHFDLVFSHAHPVRIEPSTVPIVLGDSSSNLLYLTAYKGLPEWLVRTSYVLIRRQLAKIFRIADQTTTIAPARRLVLWSNFAVQLHERLRQDPALFRLIAPGIPLPSESQVREHRADRCRLLFVGGQFLRKGGPMLLSTFFHLADQYPQLELTVVGGVSSELIQTHPRLKIHPRVSWSELHERIIPEADVFVLLSERAEGYGMSVLQAASYGVSAIVTAIGALPELVVNERTGLVIPPGDERAFTNALRRLLEDLPFRQALGRQARKRIAEEFSLERFQTRLLQEFQKKRSGLTTPRRRPAGAPPR